jgi:hypothetical protein
LRALCAVKVIGHALYFNEQIDAPLDELLGREVWTAAASSSNYHLQTVVAPLVSAASGE